MIVDTRNETIDVMLFFEKPLSKEQQVKLEYILDQLVEIESDYHEITD